MRSDDILIIVLFLVALVGLPTAGCIVGTLDAERIAERNCLQYYKAMPLQDSEPLCKQILRGVK